MPNALNGRWVYAGLIHQQYVICCHPVVVIGGGGVAASFDNVDAAFRFLRARGFGSSMVYRHNGSDWDRLGLDPLKVYEAALREADDRQGATGSGAV